MGAGIVSESKDKDLRHAAGCEMVLDWLQTPNAPTRAVIVTGAAGMGKTTLLQSLLREVQESGVASLSVDGMYEGQTPDDFLRIVERVGWIRRHQVGAAEFTFPTVPGGKRVMFIDHLDERPVLLYWLRTVFSRRLPAEDFMLVMAHRRDLGRWNGSVAKIETIHLTALKRKEAVDYLSSVGEGNDERMRGLIRASHGHPALLARFAEYAVLDLAAKETHRELSDVASTLLTEIDLPGALPGVEALSILREANQDDLSAVLVEPLSSEDYFALSRLSFVHKGLHGLTMEDSVSAVLRHDFYNRSPKRFLTWVQRAVTVWAERMAECPFEQKTSSLTHILSLHTEYPAEMNGDRGNYGDYLRPSGYPLLVDVVQTSDAPMLHDLLGRRATSCGVFQFLGEEDQHGLLELVLRDYPEKLLVIRDDGDHAIAMAILLPTNSHLFASLPIATAERLLQRCHPWLGSHPSEVDFANTMLVSLFVADFDDPWASPCDSWVALMACVISLLSESLRGILFFHQADVPPIVRSLLKNLPVSPRQALDSQSVDCGFCLDFLNTSLQNWLNDLFASTPKLPIPTSPSPKAIRFAEEDIRDSLRHFHHAAYLTEFAKERQLNMTGDKLRDLILGFLITEQVPLPLTKEHQRILRVTYIDRPGNAESIANRLAISRTTYYRQLAEAHRNFAEAFRV